MELSECPRDLFIMYCYQNHTLFDTSKLVTPNYFIIIVQSRDLDPVKSEI